MESFNLTLVIPEEFREQGIVLGDIIMTTIEIIDDDSQLLCFGKLYFVEGTTYVVRCEHTFSHIQSH